jgi:hypothetical protein
MEQAKVLFKQGLDDMMAERYDSGCPALEQSYQLSGLAGALFTLAECNAKWGKMATALKHYRSYLAAYSKLSPEKREKQGERQKLASEQVAALQGAAPKLVIALAAGTPEGVIIKRDGELVPADDIGAPMPVDPGGHSVEATFPSGETKTYEVEMAAAENKRLVIRLPSAGEQDAPAPDEDGSGDSMRTWALVIGGVGLVGVVVGAATGAGAIATRGTLDDNCVDTVCNQEGKDAADTTKLLGNISTISFAVGGAALVTGVVLYLIAPNGEDTEASAARWSLGPTGDGRGAQLQWRGSW